jgi:hypothetical protein
MESPTAAEFVAANADALNAGAEPFAMVSPDAMGAVASHVEREYGYGYRIGLVSSSFGGAGLFQVLASDGGRFRLYCDRYGNVARVPDVPA